MLSWSAESFLLVFQCGAPWNGLIRKLSSDYAAQDIIAAVAIPADYTCCRGGY